MKQKIYQIDAFTDEVFKGNPAAVCPLTSWLDNATLQNIAKENNLSETAFYVNKGNEYEIRWFTPTVEVDLCGHATLATAYVLFNREGHKGESIDFNSPRSGKLNVTKRGELLMLNFPVDVFEEIALSPELTAGFNIKPIAAYKGKTDFMLVFESENDIKVLAPDLNKLAKLDTRGIIVTAKGDKTDFVSRFFAPRAGINEDPVCGSAHTTMIPYWSKITGKGTLTAFQLSERTGFLQCVNLGDRVEIGGYAKLYLEGEIYL